MGNISWISLLSSCNVDRSVSMMIMGILTALMPLVCWPACMEQTSSSGRRRRESRSTRAMPQRSPSAAPRASSRNASTSPLRTDAGTPRRRLSSKIFLWVSAIIIIIISHCWGNVPTAGAQALLMDYTYGERAIAHHAGPVRVSWSRLHFQSLTGAFRSREELEVVHFWSPIP
jgi:hypothetical protein